MKELTVTTSLDQIKPVTDFVNAQLAGYGCAEEIRLELDVAIDEIFGNIIKYAYVPETGPVTIRTDVEEPHCLVITFIDRGIPFNPLTRENPNLSQPLKDRSIGGLGLYIVKNIMDDISYRFEDGQNILTVRKNIAPEATGLFKKDPTGKELS